MLSVSVGSGFIGSGFKMARAENFRGINCALISAWCFFRRGSSRVQRGALLMASAVEKDDTIRPGVASMLHIDPVGPLAGTLCTVRRLALRFAHRLVCRSRMHRNARSTRMRAGRDRRQVSRDRVRLRMPATTAMNPFLPQCSWLGSQLSHQFKQRRCFDGVCVMISQHDPHVVCSGKRPVRRHPTVAYQS